MGFQGVSSQYFLPPLNVNSIAPYYGMSTLNIATEAMILGLANRGTPGSLDKEFTLDAPVGSGLFMYWASPKVFGPVEFFDMDSQFYGGWDGANDDYWNIYGPIEVTVTIQNTPVIFYVYRTDHEDLGPCNWRTRFNDGTNY